MADWKLKVSVQGTDSIMDCGYEDFEKWKDESIPVAKYVPKKEGEAVSFMKLLKELSCDGSYTHAKFRAEDGYAQTIKMKDLQTAFLLFKQDGQPLKKGFPVRLYVPSGDIDCLNVKSVVEIELLKKE